MLNLQVIITAISEETNELDEIDGSTDNDILVWSFSSPEERVAREERPVIEL